MDRLKDKVAVIVGGANGLGEATAKLFGQEGAAVAVCDLSEANGVAVAEAIRAEGAAAEFFKMDVTSEENVQAVFEAINQKFGKINILVNCAGIIGTTRRPDEIEFDEWEKVLAVDCGGTFSTCRHVIKYMRQQGGGSIVNISSISGLKAENVGTVPYHAAKGGVISLTKSFAIAYAEEKIRCNCVCPAATLTKLTCEFGEKNYGSAEAYEKEFAAMIPMRRLGRPINVAYAILYLASDEAEWTTGVALPVDGGQAAS